MDTRSILKTLASSLFALALLDGCGGGSTPQEDTEEDVDGGASKSASGGSSPSAAASGNLPCDVDKVLADNCRSCHGSSPSYGAPMPLVTYADLVAPSKSNPAKKVHELVTTRVHDDARPMPPPPNARLGAADLATLDAWSKGGATSSTATCGSNGGGGTTIATKPLSCTPDVKIRPTSKAVVPGDKGDFYMCYGFDTTSTSKRHAIAFAPHIDNTRVVHHLLLFQADAAQSGTPVKCGQSGMTNMQLVTGWAPGGGNFELPPEAGFATEGTTHWVLQVHYNNAQALQGQEDESGFDVCTTDQLRPNDAGIMAPGTIQISIPPRSTHAVSCTYNWGAQMPKIHVFGSSPHMHLRGRSLTSDLQKAAGGTDVLLNTPNFDFANGGGGDPVSVDISPGDKIKTTCKWENTGDTTVALGEGTNDEMCFAFMTYYPRITTKTWKWMLPSVVAKCETGQ
ncbi:MAG: peptidylglycine alpha-amidating monooxygenase [Polyangiaceae bacterium]